MPDDDDTGGGLRGGTVSSGLALIQGFNKNRKPAELFCLSNARLAAENNGIDGKMSDFGGGSGGNLSPSGNFTNFFGGSPGIGGVLGSKTALPEFINLNLTAGTNFFQHADPESTGSSPRPGAASGSPSATSALRG